jgi:predicted N-acetyltransferase YhbS
LDTAFFAPFNQNKIPAKVLHTRNLILALPSTRPLFKKWYNVPVAPFVRFCRVPIQYIKRLQMSFDFRKKNIPKLFLPDGFRFVSWDLHLLDIHADVKHRSFKDDTDAVIFPTFREYDRCLRLMESIATSHSFLPEATLLIAHGQENELVEYVANIQGMKHSPEVGGIQNVAVLPAYRRKGLGQALLYGALNGFRNAGLQKVSLEVTADNLPAVRLYHRVGFETFHAYFREFRTE